MEIFKPLCYLCGDYANESLMCSKCQNRFCKECINDYSQLENKCPSCQEIINNDLFIPFQFDYAKIKIINYSQLNKKIDSLIAKIDDQINNSLIEKEKNEIIKQKENYIQKITKKLKIDIYQGFYLKFLLDLEYNKGSLKWFKQKYQEIEEFLSKKIVGYREIEKNINLNKYTPPTYYQCRYIQIKSPTTIEMPFFDKKIFNKEEMKKTAIKLLFVKDKSLNFYTLSIIKLKDQSPNIKTILQKNENYVKVTFKLFHKELLIKKEFKYNVDKEREKIEQFIPCNLIEENKLYKVSFSFKMSGYNYFSSNLSSVIEITNNKKSFSLDSILLSKKKELK